MRDLAQKRENLGQIQQNIVEIEQNKLHFMGSRREKYRELCHKSSKKREK